MINAVKHFVKWFRETLSDAIYGIVEVFTDE